MLASDLSSLGWHSRPADHMSANDRRFFRTWHLLFESAQLRKTELPAGIDLTSARFGRKSAMAVAYAFPGLSFALEVIQFLPADPFRLAPRTYLKLGSERRVDEPPPSPWTTLLGFLRQLSIRMGRVSLPVDKLDRSFCSIACGRYSLWSLRQARIFVARGRGHEPVCVQTFPSRNCR
jgi:hypothetical protein